MKSKSLVTGAALLVSAACTVGCGSSTAQQRVDAPTVSLTSVAADAAARDRIARTENAEALRQFVEAFAAGTDAGGVALPHPPNDAERRLAADLERAGEAVRLAKAGEWGPMNDTIRQIETPAFRASATARLASAGFPIR